MPHFPKPFFRKPRGRWYLQLDGRQINLGPDQEAAFELYHQLMAQRGQEPAPEDHQGGSEHPLVVSVLDDYLDWLQARCSEGSKEPRTFEWYARFLQSFADSISDPQSFTVDQLIPAHVYEWVDAHKGWKRSRRGAMIAVGRAFRWAERAGLLKSIGGRSPLAGLEKPPAGRRDRLISPEEFTALLALVTDQPFRDLLISAWETGARPHELFIVEGRHVDLQGCCWAFPAAESKGKRHPRTVYLSDRALEITKRLMQTHPSGPLFRNRNGLAWCRYSVNCRFDDLKIKLGRIKLVERGRFPEKLKRLTKEERQDSGAREKHRLALLERRKEIDKLARKLGPKYSLYAIRHSWCTRLLESGRVGHETVRELMGHRSGDMIARVYGHLDQRPEHLKDAARKAGGA